MGNLYMICTLLKSTAPGICFAADSLVNLIQFYTASSGFGI